MRTLTAPMSFVLVHRLLLFAVMVTAAKDLKRDNSKLNRPGRSWETKIKKTLLSSKHYDKTTRPVVNHSTTVVVNVAISLYHILDTNEKQQTMLSLLSVRQRWKDEYLTWNASDYGGVSTIRIPANMIWTPDLVISNYAGDKFNDFMNTNAIVTSEGFVLWLVPALIKTYCTLDVRFFPFDKQKCQLEFISWTYSGYELDVVYNSSFKNMVYYVATNQEWSVRGISAVRHEKKYACCEEPYPDVTFTIHMNRGSLFYIFNLIFPCFLIYLVSFLGFFLPVESGEKVNLEITILLALVVFLLMVGETLPPTPDAIPILGMFFGSTMVMVTIALIMAVTITNIYAKKNTYQRCPRWILSIAVKFYPPELIHPKIKYRKQPYNGNNKDMQFTADITAECISMTESEGENFGHCGCCGCCKRGFEITTDGERNEVEWKILAKFADRVFFWIFFALSVIVQSWLFSQLSYAS